MSKGNNPIKVLRTALNRVDKGWTQGTWSYRDPETGQMFVCLEGGLFGYCAPGEHTLTEAQIEARDLCLEVIKERYPQYDAIPSFNDERGHDDIPRRTKEEVKEVIKLAIIRKETAGDGEIDDEDFDNLLEFMDAKE